MLKQEKDFDPKKTPEEIDNTVSKTKQKIEE